MPYLNANSNPNELVLAAEGELTIDAADEQKRPQVSILAYTGGLMQVNGWGPVVVDLEGLEIKAGRIPLLADHATNLGGVIGHGEAKKDGGRLVVAGEIAPVTEAARQIVELARSGFQFQASIGVRPSKVQQIKAGRSVTVNGRTVKSDRSWFLVNAGLLRETSIVAIGADPETGVSVAASDDSFNKGASEMDEKLVQWLAAHGWENPDDISESQLKVLQAAYAAEQTPPVSDPSKKDVQAGVGDVDAFLEAQAAETERIAGIRTTCRGEYPAIEAQAIRERWSVEKTELEVLRKARKHGPAIHDGSPQVNRSVLECAVRMAGAERDDALCDEYGEQTIEASERYRGMGLRRLVDLCCRMDGVTPPGFGDSPHDIMAAGYSTSVLSGVLGDSARKSMQAAYRDFPSAAKMIAKKLTATDFKTHTGYRLTGDFVMKEVGAGGEIKHATINEESYTYSVATYGRIFGVTRTMLVNDDLGAFTEIPRMLGRGAAIALEQAFWTLVLANTGSFFGSGNSNQITATLASAGLASAVTTFRKLTDADGNPIMSMPRFLLVPPDLEEAADELFVSTNVNTGGSSTTAKVPNRNVHANKYQPIVSPYISNTSYTGSSTTQWYLLADPADVAAFGIAYLNGNERPTIEEVDVRNDTLGKAWRGYLDFGVCQVDKRGGVKSTGAG